MAETDGLEALLPVSLDWWSTLVLSSRNLAYRLAFNTLLSTAPETRPMLRAVLEPELMALDRYRAVSDAVIASDPLRAEQACRELVDLGTNAILTALEHL